MFAQIIRDPALHTEAITIFLGECKSPFLIMCLLASLAAAVYTVQLVTPRKREAGPAELISI